MSDAPPIIDNLPLKSAPYYSRISPTIESGYPLLAFKPGFALQASELNEIQENFYVQKTLSDGLITNWWKTGTNLELTGLQTEKLYGPGWEGAIPFTPENVFNIDFLGTNIEQISFNTSGTFPGKWFLLTDPSTKLKFWKFLNNSTLAQFSVNIFPLLYSTYWFGFNVSSSIIPCSLSSEEEGYIFNDNSTGNYIENTCGASRYKLNVTGFKVVTSLEGETNFLPIMKYRRNADADTQNIKLYQYMNNYLISRTTG